MISLASSNCSRKEGGLKCQGFLAVSFTLVCYIWPLYNSVSIVQKVERSDYLIKETIQWILTANVMYNTVMTVIDLIGVVKHPLHELSVDAASLDLLLLFPNHRPELCDLTAQPAGVSNTMLYQTVQW